MQFQDDCCLGVIVRMGGKYCFFLYFLQSFLYLIFYFSVSKYQLFSIYDNQFMFFESVMNMDNDFKLGLQNDIVSV